MAMKLAETEKADLFIVEMAALLHDLDDYKIAGGSTECLPQATTWLKESGVGEKELQHILSIINQLSFKGAGVETPMSSIEGYVVQDADRLDAIGAIGIARTFMYGGAKGRQMYNSNEKVVMHQSFNEYKKSSSSVIGHFYEKLLLLKDRMNTALAKQIAEERHSFMEHFLKQFYSEQENNN